MSIQIPGYKIVGHLAEGGMASVYLATQESLGRKVVIKVLKKTHDVYQSARFKHEGRIIASLNHRNIITIYDIGVIRDMYFISMEYLEGGDLEERMLTHMDVDAALDLVEEIGSCLDFLHGKDIVHRDIKPANILFHKDGTPILTDFGVAKQQEVDIKLTRDGTALGSPFYISPEQAECKVLDGRADIYSLGIILYEMLTGSKPFEGDSYMETIIAHLSQPIPDLPPELSMYQELVERMIAKNRDHRFATAGEMVDYLRALRGGVPEQAPPRRHAPAMPDLYATGPVQRPAGGHAPARSPLGALLADNGTTLVVGGLIIMFVLAMGVLNFGALLADRADPGAPSAQAAAPVTTNMPVVAAAPAGREGDYLRKARQARSLLRFATPADDSAYYYYRKVLEIDPDHPEALQGIAEIAKIYADLAEWALNKGAYRKATEYVNTGLRVSPDDARLRKLHSSIQSSGSRDARQERGAS